MQLVAYVVRLGVGNLAHECVLDGGLSTRGSISLGRNFVADRKRVPGPAADSTALRTRAGVAVSESERLRATCSLPDAGLCKGLERGCEEQGGCIGSFSPFINVSRRLGL